MTSPHILIVGASGVVGTGAVEHFAALPGWHVTALSRRRPVTRAGGYHHVACDLADAGACRAAVAALAPVTHIVYAAASEAPGLRSGWFDENLMAANGRMFANILDPLAATGALRHVSLLQGTKAYGAHHHLIEVPAREDTPRDRHANFYWLQEDALRASAAICGFAFTIFRPQVLLGSAPGAAMNPVVAIGAYAALCRDLDRPFAFPGTGPTVWEMVDTGLLAHAFEWASTTSAAQDETFNITNGDVMVLEHAWPHLAASLGVSAEGKAPESMAGFFADADVQAAWTRLAARHDLRIADLPTLLGESHHYLDLLLGARIGAKAVPVLLSTIKLRQAGFGACRDSLASLQASLDRMVALKLLPPLG